MSNLSQESSTKNQIILSFNKGNSTTSSGNSKSRISEATTKPKESPVILKSNLLASDKSSTNVYLDSQGSILERKRPSSNFDNFTENYKPCMPLNQCKRSSNLSFSEFGRQNSSNYFSRSNGFENKLIKTISQAKANLAAKEIPKASLFESTAASRKTKSMSLNLNISDAALRERRLSKQFKNFFITNIEVCKKLGFPGRDGIAIYKRCLEIIKKYGNTQLVFLASHIFEFMGIYSIDVKTGIFKKIFSITHDSPFIFNSKRIKDCFNYNSNTKLLSKSKIDLVSEDLACVVLSN